MRRSSLSLLLPCLVVLAVLVSGCETCKEESLLAANKEFVRRQHEELWNKGNMAIVDDDYTPNFVGHFPFGQSVGRKDLKKEVALHRAAFPDWTEQVEDLIAEGDRVVSRFTSRGTHRGEFHCISPTGRSVTISEVAIFRISDGRIAEQWVFPDVGSLLEQLETGSDNP